MPDTQFYSQDNPGIFTAQTNWIRTNLAGENIIYVAHLGDIVDSFGCNAGPTEWGNADTAMDVLDGTVAPGDDIPYGVLPGNHDFDPTTPGGPVCSAARVDYNANFGPSRYGAFYGGSQDGTTNDNNYTLFSSAGGVDFIAINLAYSGAAGPTELATLAWADNLLKANPNRIGIVTSHFILTDSRTNGGAGGANCTSSDDFGMYGRAMWDELKDNPNLTMVLGGHCSGEKWITFQGGGGERPGCLGDVHALMSNYQFYNGSASGYLRIMRFDTAARTLEVETFSPTLPGGGSATTLTNPALMDTNSVSNFSLDYNAFVGQCVDVALVMDRSGSMNAASPVAPKKIDALMNAANMFIDQIALDDRHRVAMVQFNSALVPFSVPEIPFVDLNVGNAAPAHQMVNSIVAGGSTDILDGLQGGVNKLDVVSPNDRRVVVLFTDGKHNSPNPLSVGPLQTQLASRINSVDPAMEFYSVGFGTDISDAALNTVTSANGGWHVDEVDPIVVAKTFSLVAARVMDNQTLSDPVYVIKSGETKSHRIRVSRSDTNLTIAVNWDRFDPDRIRTNVVPPGGASCSIASDATVSGVQQTSGRNYRLVRINLPFPCNSTAVHEGDWHVEMTATEEVRTEERVNIVAYAASAIKLTARVDLVAGHLNITAILGGAPLKDATFSAHILPPLPESGDSTSLDILGSDPVGAASIPPLALIPRNSIVVPLKVVGQTAETIDAAGTFDPRRKGLYQVRVIADLIDGSGQSVNREAMASFYSPKARFFPGFNWISILVILVLLLASYGIFRSVTRRRKA
ncbi:MAG: VWA domain-containing protein [Gammaproteobacteria bacterium]|nr:VWA domain-containing protein [Gammaproteobacteria bacterium]